MNVYNKYAGYLRSSLRKVERTNGDRTIYYATLFGVTGIVLAHGADRATEQTLSASDGGPSPTNGTVLRETGYFVTREEFDHLWGAVPAKDTYKGASRHV